MPLRLCLIGALALGLLPVAAAEQPKPLKVLFLGDKGHHQPILRFRQLQPVLAKRGIELSYVDNVDVLNSATLAKYDALALYANTTAISPEQEKALLDYVG